ncbi:MAG: hypothetical protein IJS01_08950 [Lentisphaeria bacterium]|nr:hypothetical protein [Lentisphaeria bacterium]
MRKFWKIFFGALGLGALCGCAADQAAFGAKMCAVYQNYDSTARHLRSARDAGQNSAAAWMYLGVAERYRGRIPEMHAAWANAEAKDPFPELFLLRADWYIENGEAAKAEADLAHLRKLLLQKDLPAGHRYYRFLLIRSSGILDVDHDRDWKKIRDGGYRSFLRAAAEKLEEKRTRLARTPGPGLFALRRFSDPAWRSVSFGMTEKELRERLGEPQRVIDLARSRRRALVYVRDDVIAGFLFSRETAQLGEVRTAPVCKLHGALFGGEEHE